MVKANLKNYIKLVLGELIYTIVTIVFLVRLNRLNRILTTSAYTNDMIKLLSYNNYSPLWFFGGTVALVVIGALLIGCKIDRIKNTEMCCGEIMASGMAMLAITVLIVLLIIFIDNPILRTILTVLCAIVGSVYLAAQ